MGCDQSTAPGLPCLFEISDSNATSVHIIPAEAIDVQYYPNPFGQNIRIDYTIDNNTLQNIPLEVYNALGQSIEKRMVPATTGSLELGDRWEAGIYFIRIGSKTIKVIKTKG